MRQTEYEWVYLYGAVNPATGDSVGMVGGSVGIEWMNQHLSWISEHVRGSPGGDLVDVVLVLDRAGWHVSPKVKWPSNIRPLYLPSYSPELNPVERLWHWLRSHRLSNRVYRDVEHLYEATTEAWNGVTPERLKTVCRAPYMSAETNGVRIIGVLVFLIVSNWGASLDSLHSASGIPSRMGSAFVKCPYCNYDLTGHLGNGMPAIACSECGRSTEAPMPGSPAATFPWVERSRGLWRTFALAWATLFCALWPRAFWARMPREGSSRGSRLALWVCIVILLPWTTSRVVDATNVGAQCIRATRGVDVQGINLFASGPCTDPHLTVHAIVSYRQSGRPQNGPLRAATAVDFACPDFSASITVVPSLLATLIWPLCAVGTGMLLGASPGVAKKLGTAFVYSTSWMSVPLLIAGIRMIYWLCRSGADGFAPHHTAGGQSTWRVMLYSQPFLEPFRPVFSEDYWMIWSITVFVWLACWWHAALTHLQVFTRRSAFLSVLALVLAVWAGAMSYTRHMCQWRVPASSILLP